MDGSKSTEFDDDGPNRGEELCEDEADELFGRSRRAGFDSDDKPRLNPREAGVDSPLPPIPSPFTVLPPSEFCLDGRLLSPLTGGRGLELPVIAFRLRHSCWFSTALRSAERSAFSFSCRRTE